MDKLKIFLEKYRLCVKKYYIISLVVSAMICGASFIVQKALNEFSFSYLSIISSATAFIFVLIYKFNEAFPNANSGFFRIIKIKGMRVNRNQGIGLSRAEQEKKRINDATEDMLTVASALIPISAICLIVCILINL